MHWLSFYKGTIVNEAYFIIEISTLNVFLSRVHNLKPHLTWDRG